MKKNIQFKQFTLIGIISLGSVLLFSCKNMAEKTAEKMIEKSIELSSGENVDIDIEEGTAVIETKDGRVEVNTSANKWPDDIPSDVPEFKHGKINAVSTNSSDEGNGWTLVISDVPADAIDEYNTLLKSEGFETQTLTYGDAGGSVTAEKDKVVIALMASEGSASLSVQVEL